MSTIGLHNPPREVAVGIVRRLQGTGFAAFWVGGCVRDFLLGREPGDYDIVTSALPGQIYYDRKKLAAFRHSG